MDLPEEIPCYLRGRGMTDDTVRAWRLGWAPNDWRALTTFLAGQGVANADMVAAGMALLKERLSARLALAIALTIGGVFIAMAARLL